jgi:hypothetical protein
MTSDRRGLAAGVSSEASTLEVEILAVVARANQINAGEDYPVHKRRIIGAILRAIAESALFQNHLSQSREAFGDAVKEASVAISWYLDDLDRPFARLEEDILRRLREVPAASDLKTRYPDDRDAECVRRRGLIAALLGAAQSNTFDRPHSNEIVIDPADIDQQNRTDLSAAINDFYIDLGRLDGGQDAKYCLAKAETRPDRFIEPGTKRDALIWAMVAIDTGADHPVYNTQEKRCALFSEYVDCASASLLKYLQALRKGVRHDDRKRFSPAEHQSFKDRCAQVRRLTQKGENALDLLLPGVRGWHDRQLPKPASKGKTG